MKTSCHHLRCLLMMIITCCMYNHTEAQKITDTIFFNKAWKICEKPIAAYYRIGTLAIDSFWFYTGKIRDYDMKGTLLMEGEYSEDGYKNGLFRFYYPDGKLQMQGNFLHDQMTGNWQWNHANDSLAAVINFDHGESDFRFITYKTEEGKMLLENGTGNFVINSGSKEPFLQGFKVHGFFNEGKRSGTWKYYSQGSGKNEFLMLTEKYNDDGNYKRTIASSNYFASTPKSRYDDFNFIPHKIWVTEHMEYDDFFRKGGEANSDLALIKFLLNRQSSEIIVKNKNIEDVLLFIIQSLERNRNRLEYQEKEIDGKITFKIADKGSPEDIVVSGKGLTEKEKEFIVFLVSKFSKIEMPGTETVAIESYYTIYLYSINMKEYVPSFLKSSVNNDIFFSTLPKDKFIVLLQTQKKKIKKYIREEYSFYW